MIPSEIELAIDVLGWLKEMEDDYVLDGAIDKVRDRLFDWLEDLES